MNAHPDEGKEGGLERDQDHQDELLRDFAALEQSRAEGAPNAFEELGGLGAAADEVLHISADGLVARLWRLDAETTHEQLELLFARHEICFGIDREAIERALESVSRGQVQHDLVVARGTEPRILEEAHIAWRPGIEEGEEDFAALRRQLQARSLDLAARGGVRPCAVATGEMVAKWLPARVEAGRTVRGHEVRPLVQSTTGLRPGTYVMLSDDGRYCSSEIYGYAGLANDRLVVVPPFWVAPGGSEVHFVHWPQDEPPEPPTPETLQQLLVLEGIEHGIDAQGLAQVCAALRTDASRPFTHLIARATPVAHGGLAQISYPFDLRRLLTWEQMQGLLRSSGIAVLREELGLLLRDRGLLFPLLVRGELVAQKTSAKSSMPGLSVTGEEIVPDDMEDMPLEVGEFIELSEDGLRSTADLCGYACLRAGHIELVPPVWVEPSAGAAYFLNLPQEGKPTYPNVEDMREILDLLGVQHGYRASVWESTLNALRAGKALSLLVPVARATPHGESRDAVFEWQVDIEGDRVGKILEDGSIDFRARKLAPMVHEGEVIGSLSLPQRGVSGRDVLGRELPAPQPANVEVVNDARIRVEEEGARVVFYAECGGEVISEMETKRTRQRTRRRVRIGISLVSNIDGDVGYSTGNVEFSGDVIISGSVQALFSVRAEGSVHIGGYIEDGAHISAGKDIMVRGGIIGAATQVQAGGSLWAKFVQEASIHVGGDVRVGAYIFNASVRASGKVVVLGRGEGKARALVGGLVWGGEGLEILSVGSPYNSATRLVAGVDPKQVEHLEKLRADLYACEERMQTFMEALGLASLDIEAIRARLQKPASREKRRDALLALKRLTRLSERRMVLRGEMEEIVEAQRVLARRARIVVRGTLYSGVEVRLGEESLSFNEERQRLQLRLSEEEGRLRVVEGPIIS